MLRGGGAPPPRKYMSEPHHMSDPEGGRAPGRPRRPRVDLRGPREGVRALRRIAPKRKIHPATGPWRPREGLLSWPRRSPPLLVRHFWEPCSQKCWKNIAKRSKKTAKYRKIQQNIANVAACETLEVGRRRSPGRRRARGADSGRRSSSSSRSPARASRSGTLETTF